MEFITRGAKALLACCLLLWWVVLIPSTAVAEDCRIGNYPTRGALETHRLTNSDYSATFRFILTAEQISNLRCLAEYLEIDFVLEGFSTPPDWDDYQVDSTNIPGAVHDEAFEDRANEPRPGVTAIFTSELVPAHEYYATLSWNRPLQPGVVTPTLGIGWSPSRWAHNFSNESISCNLSLIRDQWAWCIFPVVHRSVIMGPNVMGLPDGKLGFSGTQIYRFPMDVAPQPYPGYGPKLAATRSQDGRLVVFYVGGDNAIYYQFQMSPGGS